MKKRQSGIKVRLFNIFIICMLLFPSCIRHVNISHQEITVKKINRIDPLRKQAAAITSSMSDNLLAAHVLISGIDGRGKLSSDTQTLFKEVPTGGLMLFRYNLNTNTDDIRNFIDEAVTLIKDESQIPPFIAVDHEGGTINRFLPSVTILPSASSYWEQFTNEGREATLAKIESDSLESGLIINELGVNMNFAPVAEYLSDENRRFLSARSYGPDPIFTAHAASSFMRGMEKAGILCVVKHFPGSAGTDPHHAVSVLHMDKHSLNRFVYPFAVLINQGARAVMAAHTLAPAIDTRIASLSPVVMQNWLRGELGFDGIIVSDDFIMAAAGDQHPSDAAVQAIAAGADMILIWPGHLRQTHNTILAALENGRLSKDRLINAVNRIIYEKLRLGLIEQ